MERDEGRGGPVEDRRDPEADDDDEEDYGPPSPWPRADHVVRKDDGGFRCTHCGRSQDMAFPCLIDVYVAASKAFAKLHARCQAPTSPHCTFCHSAEHLWDEHVGAVCHRPSDWLHCGDTDAGSRAIFHHFVNGQSFRPEVPLDPEDFGRCYRLLSAPWAKQWREQIGEMARYPEWKPLVEHWEELERLYLEEKASGSAPKLYALMQALRVE